MATFKLGLGGKATFNPNYAVYPQTEDPALKNFAMHKAWPLIRLNRVLDFNPISGDTAMQSYLKGAAVGGLLAVGDILELDAIVSPSILVAVMVNVIVPEAGFNFTVNDRAGAIATAPAVTGGTAGALLSPAGPTLKNYVANNMLQLVATGVGAAFPKALKLNVCAVFIDFDNRPL
jgi:hypothetical protein